MNLIKQQQVIDDLYTSRGKKELRRCPRSSLYIVPKTRESTTNIYQLRWQIVVLKLGYQHERILTYWLRFIELLAFRKTVSKYKSKHVLWLISKYVNRRIPDSFCYLILLAKNSRDWGPLIFNADVYRQSPNSRWQSGRLTIVGA